MEKATFFSLASIILIKTTSSFPFTGVVSLCTILTCLETFIDFYSWIWWKNVGKGESTDTDAKTALKPCSKTGNVSLNLSRREVEFVMDKMDICLDPKGGKLEERLGLDEIGGLFDEELSLEEVKEAFGVFDKNCDGFIDVDELEKVLCALGFFRAIPKVECQRMIRVYDDNGDGKIDFSEFVNLLGRTSL